MNLSEYFQNKFGSIDFLFDSHCHLTWFDEQARTEVVSQSVESGLEKIIDIAVDLKTSKATLENARKFSGIVLPTAGIDPEIAIPGSELFIKDLTPEKVEEKLSELGDFIKENHRELLMIGECGLDYYWIYKNNLSETEINKSKDFQQQFFARQIELAEKYSLPLSIHHRDSLDDCLELLKNKNVSAIFHSFTGGIQDAEKILADGFTIGINGIVTYKSAEDIREAVKKILLGKSIDSPEELYNSGIFLETDAPFLPPRGAKSRENSPKNIKIIFDFLKKEVLG